MGYITELIVAFPLFCRVCLIGAFWKMQGNIMADGTISHKAGDQLLWIRFAVVLLII